MQILCRKPVPAFIYAKAIQSLTSCRSRKTGKWGHLTKQVGRHWRLLSKDEGETWHLISHAEYNHTIDRRH